MLGCDNSNCHNPGQGRAELSNLEWWGILTIFNYIIDVTDRGQSGDIIFYITTLCGGEKNIPSCYKQVRIIQ